MVPVETTTTNNTDDKDDIDQKNSPQQKLMITKMTQELADKVVLKGVITKSPYIEAYCPKKECKYFFG